MSEQKSKNVEHEEFDMRGVYTNKCDCGKEIEVRTQEDNNPEYYTDVYVKCDCSLYVLFNLPVN
jgi:hypothetical protein